MLENLTLSMFALATLFLTIGLLLVVVEVFINMWSK